MRARRPSGIHTVREHTAPHWPLSAVGVQSLSPAPKPLHPQHQQPRWSRVHAARVSFAENCFVEKARLSKYRNKRCSDLASPWPGHGTSVSFFVMLTYLVVLAQQVFTKIVLQIPPHRVDMIRVALRVVIIDQRGSDAGTYAVGCRLHALVRCCSAFSRRPTIVGVGFEVNCWPPHLRLEPQRMQAPISILCGSGYVDRDCLPS